MSMNCRGLAGQHKRRDVLNFIRESSFDVIFLQDTHITSNQTYSFNRLWPGKCYHACKSSLGRGTCILIRRTIQHDIIFEKYDEDGNYVALVCRIYAKTFTFINIYGLNEDNPGFFRMNDDLLQQLPYDNVVIGGDLNFVLDQTIDCNYLHENNVRAKSVFVDITKKYDLIDIWRNLHPSRREYTWLRCNPLKHGRLDMFFYGRTPG